MVSPTYPMYLTLKEWKLLLSSMSVLMHMENVHMDGKSTIESIAKEGEQIRKLKKEIKESIVAWERGE